jgi:hypothetical protein
MATATKKKIKKIKIDLSKLETDFINENFLLNGKCINDYLKPTGNKQAYFQGFRLFINNGNLLGIKNSKIYLLQENVFYDGFNVSSLKNDNKIYKYKIVGIILKFKNKIHYIASADKDNNYLIDENFISGSMSFICLNRFIESDDILNETDHNDIFDLIATGKIKIVDFTKDSTIQTKDRKSPGKGYTLIDSNLYHFDWHRPATFLFNFVDIKYQVIMGQDEGSYFACELPKGSNCKTVNDAFTALIPKEIRNKKGVKRQGEWFLVPITEKELPKFEDIRFEFHQLSLPRDNEDSAYHQIYAEAGIVTKNNKVYAFNLNLNHSDGNHLSIDESKSDKWFCLYKNTAVRSFSQEGVD